MYNRSGIIYTNAEKPGYGKFDPYEVENGGWGRIDRMREKERERERVRRVEGEREIVSYRHTHLNLYKLYVITRVLCCL